MHIFADNIYKKPEERIMSLSRMIEKNCNKLIFDCSNEELYLGLLKTVSELKNEKKQSEPKKKLYYISAEFLIGKMLESNLIALGIYDEVKKILDDNGKTLSDVTEIENEPSLGNGGLGRLAACFLDSVAHLGLSGDGIGILYHYGLFKQKFLNNKQSEEKNPWITPEGILNKTDVSYITEVNGHKLKSRLYTIDIIGKRRNNKLNLFDIETVDENIVRESVVYDKTDIEKNLTLFLYPDDSDESGRKLRLCQEYFMASNAAQFIVEECVRRGSNLKDLSEYAVIQINDTHPSLIIPELIRIFVGRGIDIDTAIDVVRKVCAYTNHTILSEALEVWKTDVIRDMLPQIYKIIEVLDKRIKNEYEDNSLYIINNGIVRMASMDIHYGFSVNGVASLHTSILKETELNNFYKIYPQKFNNKTNGISMRRWLIAANPRLFKFIVSLIGNSFVDDYEKLKELLKYTDDESVLRELLRIKAENKSDLSRYIKEKEGIIIDPDSIFDVQIKRLHEYKRQQLNVLYLINKYFDIKRGIIPKTPITAIFGAKAAGSYTIAKDIIHLILCLKNIVNSDENTSQYLKIFMAENYNVTWAEHIIPAADISEQISLASKEASGTGNMKLMLNGALTLGTCDGANVEIHSLVGDGNIYTFGDSSEKVIQRYKNNSYDASVYYNSNARIKEAVDFITGNEMLSVGDKQSLSRLKTELIKKDYFMTFPDFEQYTATRNRMYSDYENEMDWAKKMLVNIAMSGYFSSDRTIKEYNKDIWRLEYEN